VYSNAFEGKPMPGPVIIKKKKTKLYDEIKLTDNCIFCEGGSKKLRVRT
jgi:hypothetical protein